MRRIDHASLSRRFKDNGVSTVSTSTGETRAYTGLPANQHSLSGLIRTTHQRRRELEPGRLSTLCEKAEMPSLDGPCYHPIALGG